MGFMQSLSAWNQERKEKRLSQYEEQGLCPDCRGKGFHMLVQTETFYSPPYDCYGCNGSGSYTDWSANQLT
ncbi:methionine aminopeptidase [Salirhabdus salicampi]|uniref:methionine aminopeptidase n=1 Tax=Salirhabdus salicampi TaxID=476102 RepID=UPI0020C5A495|nr:methionine aminopeptidase [Salirhabdus salicampi]MCP8615731.1 methionine aminopeptidase [Salirhabdus salicampi]